MREVSHNSFRHVPWLIPTCAMTHSSLCHDSFLPVPWLRTINRRVFSNEQILRDRPLKGLGPRVNILKSQLANQFTASVNMWLYINFFEISFNDNVLKSQLAHQLAASVNMWFFLNFPHQSTRSKDYHEKKRVLHKNWIHHERKSPISSKRGLCDMTRHLCPTANWSMVFPTLFITYPDGVRPVRLAAARPQFSWWRRRNCSQKFANVSSMVIVLCTVIWGARWLLSMSDLWVCLTFESVCFYFLESQLYGDCIQ